MARGRAAAVFDATAGLATIAVMGPLRRELLGRVTRRRCPTPRSRGAARAEIEVADGHALCLRVSFVGELGYELYPSADQAVNLYDALVEAGADLGLRHAGYHALDSLRFEKGYRHLGHDIGPVDDPYEAGLGLHGGARKPGGFTGREALAQRRDGPGTVARPSSRCRTRRATCCTTRPSCTTAGRSGGSPAALRLHPGARVWHRVRRGRRPGRGVSPSTARAGVRGRAVRQALLRP